MLSVRKKKEEKNVFWIKKEKEIEIEIEMKRNANVLLNTASFEHMKLFYCSKNGNVFFCDKKMKQWMKNVAKCFLSVFCWFLSDGKKFFCFSGKILISGTKNIPTKQNWN